jgi:kinetochore protein NDC80
MNSSIRTLIDYLTQHEYDHSISPKILTRPAVKDFHNIVMFLFRQIDINYTSTGKFEDEVVSMFKYLGYPYMISKANIAAVGSPHAWPSLLASIMWLIELLSYDETVIAGEMADEDADADVADITASDREFNKYCGDGYFLFMTGEDDKFAECEEGFVGAYEATSSSIRDQLNELDLKNKALEESIVDVEKRRSYLPELEGKEKDYLKDLAKFQELVGQLEAHKEKLDSKVSDREQELQKILAAISGANQEIETLRGRVDTQELSPEDVKRMMAERDQLQQSQDQASKNRQILQRRVWESEMALRDRVQALEDSSRAYNGVAEDLKLVPHTARNAKGRVLHLEVDVKAKKRDGLLKTDVRADILPALQELRAELMERTITLKNESLAEKDAAEDYNLTANELQEQRNMCEAKLRRAEETYQRERAILDRASEMHGKEMEAMDTRLLRLRDTATDETRVAAAARRANEARLSRGIRYEDHQRRSKEIAASIMDVVAICAEHRELVQLRLGAVREMYVQRLDSMLTGSAAASVSSFAALAAEEYTASDYRDTSHIDYGASNVDLPSPSLVDINRVLDFNSSISLYPPNPPV